MTNAHLTARVGQSARDVAVCAAQTAVIARMRSDIAAARSTIAATGRIDDGLACRVTQGKFNATVDLGRGMGGDAAGPSPGFYARAAIVGCVAIGVKMLAAREGMAFRSVDVTVETDFDDAALMGLSARTAAPYETRITIAIETDADEATTRSVVDRALAMDPWYLALRDAQVVRRTIRLTPSVGAVSAGAETSSNRETTP